MYSYEERLQAVKLYIRFGKRIQATIRQLGYPTKNSLKQWYREYLEHGYLEPGYVRSKPKYSTEQINTAIDHYMSHGRCFSVTLKALGYPCRRTLTKWVHDRYPEIKKCVVDRTRRPTASVDSKRSAVYELCTREGSAQAVAQKLDVDRVTLYNWKNQLLDPEVSAHMKRDERPPTNTDKAELEQQVEALKRDIRNLQLEHDLLKKANELIKKDLGGNLQLLSNQKKTALVDALRNEYALPELLGRLGLARSSYFYHRSRAGLADKYAAARRVITEIFERNHRSYGYRRIQGWGCGQNLGLLRGSPCIHTKSVFKTSPLLAQNKNALY